MIVASLERTGGVFTAYRWPRALLRRHRRSRSRVHGVGINIGRRLNPCHRFWQRAIFRGAAPPAQAPNEEEPLRVCYSADAPLLTWGGDDGSDQEAHIRPEGGTDAEAPRGGTRGSGNPEASGDRRQGGSYTEEEQGLGPL